MRCAINSCGKYYHEECIAKFPNARIENNHIYCPLHVCATCAAENPKNPKQPKGTKLCSSNFENAKNYGHQDGVHYASGTQ